MKRLFRRDASDGPDGPTREAARTNGAARRPRPPALAAIAGARKYDRTFRTSVCRGTVSGSVPPHSTTVRSPNGKRTVRVVAPNADGTSRPSCQATCFWPITRPIERRVPLLVPTLFDRIGDDELVQRAFDLLRRKARGEVARDVVEPERGQHDRLGLNLRVEEPDPLLLAARVEVVRARIDGRFHGPEPELEKGSGERRDDIDPCERGAQRPVVARVGDTHLLPRPGERLQGFAAPADEPHLQPCRAGPRRARGGP